MEQNLSEQPGTETPSAPDSQSSFEDRLARLMGVPDDEERTDEGEPTEPNGLSQEGEQPEDQAGPEGQQSPDSPLFEEVEYEGKVYQVPTEIKSALMRNADYTQKSQELAEMRRQVEIQAQSSAVERQFQQATAAEFQRLSILDAAIAEFQSANWAQMSTDEVLRSRMSLDNLKEQRSAIASQVEQKRNAMLTHLANLTSEMADRGEKYLQTKIPNWSDDTRKEVQQFALSRFAPEELRNIYDPRLIQTLWEANEYRKIKTQTTATLTKARQAPPVVKPGSSKPMPTKTAQFLNYRKALASAKTPAQREEVIQRRLAQKLFGG